MASFGYQVLGFGSNAVSGPAYVEATGGDATITSGDYKIHVFTGDGTLCVASKGAGSGSDTVDYMVVAGGGVEHKEPAAEEQADLDNLLEQPLVVMPFHH